MPFNGSGVYSPPGADFPVVTNTVISSTHFNNTINDIATGLTNCLTKDGQSTPTANIKLGGFKLTGVGAPTVAGDALAFGSAGTVTTLTATTSVVTPLVGTDTAADLTFKVNGTGRWVINNASPFQILPLADNTSDVGSASLRVRQVFTPIIDSGTTGSLFLKTNNGSLVAEFSNAASIVNSWYLVASATGAPPTLAVRGSDANIPITISGQGSGAVSIATGLVVGSVAAITQFQVLHTASATRNITVTGSNGGNPTISTTAGSLAITPSVVIAGSNLSIGTNPAQSGAIAIPYTGTLVSRNQANGADVLLAVCTTVNSVNNVVLVGINTGGSSASAGVVLLARSGAGAPGTADIPSGEWALWRDTTGATTKLYYNNAGAIQSVALA